MSTEPVKTSAGSIIIPPVLQANESNIPGGKINGTHMTLSDEIAKRMKADEIATKKRNDEASAKMKPAAQAAEPVVDQVKDAGKAAPTV
jgi:hypothetical protein